MSFDLNILKDWNNSYNVIYSLQDLWIFTGHCGVPIDCDKLLKEPASLPEYDEEGIKIAKNFEYEPILIDKNIGILGGFKELAKQMPKGPILLLENDLELIENSKSTSNQIKKSIDLLSKHNAIQVRLFLSFRT